MWVLRSELVIPIIVESLDSPMKRSFPALLVAALLIPLAARAENIVELAFMPQSKTVTLLNEGGKHVAIDLKQISVGTDEAVTAFT
jgi:hypothetical protein